MAAGLTIPVGVATGPTTRQQHKTRSIFSQLKEFKTCVREVAGSHWPSKLVLGNRYKCDHDIAIILVIHHKIR